MMWKLEFVGRWVCCEEDVLFYLCGVGKWGIWVDGWGRCGWEGGWIKEVFMMCVRRMRVCSWWLILLVIEVVVMGLVVMWWGVVMLGVFVFFFVVGIGGMCFVSNYGVKFSIGVVFYVLFVLRLWLVLSFVNLGVLGKFLVDIC